MKDNELKELKFDFYNFINKYSEANQLIDDLNNIGEILLFGGAVREYIENKFSTIPRDFDIVIKKDKANFNLDNVLNKFNYKKNRFGGYKIKLNSLEFDIWEIENTWAFKNKKVECLEEEYSKRLQDTVFLNVDSIVYNLSKGIIYNDKYNNAMKKRILDVVLYDNPYEALNLFRAIIFKIKYNMKFSYNLSNILTKFIKQNDNYLNILYKSQISHYRCEKISKESLNKQLQIYK